MGRAQSLAQSRGETPTLAREPQLCIIAVEETVVDFPICIDDIFLRTFVSAVHSKVLPLDAQGRDDELADGDGADRGVHASRGEHKGWDLSQR